MISDKYDYLLKIIVVGDGAVGKTALSVRYTDGIFKDDYKMTIGVGFSIKMMDVDGYRIKIQIWDTGGQEQFTCIRPLYYHGSLGGLVVFDKTNRRSFYNVGRWFKEAYDNSGNIPLILVGNKVDLPDIQVTTEEATNLAKKFNTIYFDSSAKSGQSVDTIFESLVRMIIDPKYVDKLKEVGVEYEQSKIIYNESYQHYDKFANYAITYFQEDQKFLALEFLKRALYWAKRAEFEEGARWCGEQIVYIAQMLKISMPIEIEGIVLTCQSCNKFYSVKHDGHFVCPKCYSSLEKISSNLMKV
ncbi:MAG: GTP-binding protein [Candidatus Helarchaeota archaeon]|nr:GTP-binding protein [Candidatus Helarchaeota archaeon]